MAETLVVSTKALSTFLERELRSDHAGETGAVSIYRGILAVASLKREVASLKARGDSQSSALEQVRLELN